MFVGSSGYSSCQDNLTAARIPEPICRRLLPLFISVAQTKPKLKNQQTLNPKNK
jgi:hypothetical protein